VFQMGHECRAHLEEQRLELGILGIGDQRPVDRVEHGLMIGNLLLHVRAIERSTAQLAQPGEIVIPSLLQVLARGIGLGLRRSLVASSVAA
jgi:hypothetical protein